jgi:hypothetical protein
MKKEIAIKAAQLLEDLNAVDMAIDEIETRDVFFEIPAEVRINMRNVLENYQQALKDELEDL